MPELVWDKVGDRVYETGLDRGVLYLPDGSAVPWNGLTAVIESFDRETSPVYFDGMKVNDLTVLGDFQAAMKAVTYPDEFVEFEGAFESKPGLYYKEQKPQTFGLCYRTQVGNDLEGEADGHKIHIIYNVLATPKDKTYASLTDEPSLVEFEWDITAIPEEVEGFRPTAHIVIDTTKIDPLLLVEIETILYGSQFNNAALIPMPELVDYLNSFFRLEIIDHGDGTWTGVTQEDGFINFGTEEYFDIVAINAWYLDQDTYQVTSTTGAGDVPQIKVHDSGNGIWTATSDFSELIVETGPGEVDILNANIVVIDADTYQISDTPAAE